MRPRLCAEAFGLPFEPASLAMLGAQHPWHPDYLSHILPEIAELVEPPTEPRPKRRRILADDIADHLSDLESEDDPLPPSPYSDDEFQIEREHQLQENTQRLKDIGRAQEDCDHWWDQPIHELHEMGMLLAPTNFLRIHSQSTLRSLGLRPLEYPVLIPDPIRPFTLGKVGQ